MNPRLKKLAGSAALLLFLGLWVVGALAIGDHIPRHWLIQLIYFAVAGVGWAVPAIPFIRWIEGRPAEVPPRKTKKRAG